jgi:hypothetical protein
MEAKGDLPQVILARSASGRGARLLHGGQEQSHQHRYDADNNQ